MTLAAMRLPPIAVLAALVVILLSERCKAYSVPGQMSLALASSVQDDNRRISYDLREQSPELCDAGSRFWTGSVDISDNKTMFFWYFESRSNPQTDPVALWMSGGPGATGEFGLFKDSGPCSVNPDGNSTTRRPHAWNDKANVLYVDQPIGVGFSRITDRDLIAVSLLDGARDMYAFLSAFTADVFPDTAGRPWHITGESMAGHYVTAYTQYIVQQQRERERQGRKATLDIRSAIIVDGYIDDSRQTVGLYDYLCLDWRADGSPPLLADRAACADMAAAVPECERLGALCRDTYDKVLCRTASEHCNATVGRHFWAGVKPGGWNPYDSRLPCETPPLCSNMDHDVTLDFLNRPWVQERLGFSNVSFALIDFDTNARWDRAGNVLLPATRELAWLLDETDIRVLFINGNNDMLVNSPGQVRMLDELPWARQAWFRAQRFAPWYYAHGELSRGAPGAAGKRGGTWKGDDRLSLFLVDDAGHVAPWDQPAAVGAVMRAWIQ